MPSPGPMKPYEWLILLSILVGVAVLGVLVCLFAAGMEALNL